VFLSKLILTSSATVFNCTLKALGKVIINLFLTLDISYLYIYSTCRLHRGDSQPDVAQTNEALNAQSTKSLPISRKHGRNRQARWYEARQKPELGLLITPLEKLGYLQRVSPEIL
jgi:hypothetical protein